MSSATTSSVNYQKINLKTSVVPKISRKERRFQKEVQSLQERPTNILPQTTFKRCVTQYAMEASPNTRLRFNADAVHALQEAAEREMTNIFTGSVMVANIANRDTVNVSDMRNFLALREI
jgi:histone H3/H4|tara:strand:- start:1223 stop:1582 length:360 start_codon:yes stop_codon:yes gene_type:complete